MSSAVQDSIAGRLTATRSEESRTATRDSSRVSCTESLSVSEVFEEHFSLVWRTLRRLGVRADSLDDATQDVFLVVHRRWQDFEGRSQLRTWLLGITLKVASDFRKKQRRQTQQFVTEAEPMAVDHQTPERLYASRQAGELMYRVLDSLRPIERDILVLVDLEQTPVADAALALGVNVNTAYSRLRVARQKFEISLQRQQKRLRDGQ